MTTIAGQGAGYPFRPHAFGMIPAWVFSHPGTKPSDRDTYAALAILADRETDRLFLQIEHLARFLGCDERTAQRRLEQLVKLGLLQRCYMWWTPGASKPQPHTRVANGQAASDFRLLRADPTGFPDDAFTADIANQVSKGYQTAVDITRIAASPIREDVRSRREQGDSFDAEQGDSFVPEQGDKNATHNRELQQRTSTEEKNSDPAESPRLSPLPDNWTPDGNHRHLARSIGRDPVAIANAFITAARSGTETGRPITAHNWDAKFTQLLQALNGNSADVEELLGAPWLSGFDWPTIGCTSPAHERANLTGHPLSPAASAGAAVSARLARESSAPTRSTLSRNDTQPGLPTPPFAVSSPKARPLELSAPF